MALSIPEKVFSTAVIAYGLYPSGATTQDFEAKVSALYQSYCSYMEDSGQSVEQTDEILESAYILPDKVNLDSLPNGFYQSIRTWATGLESSEDLVVGSSSLDSMSTSLPIGSMNFDVIAFEDTEYWNSEEVQESLGILESMGDLFPLSYSDATSQFSPVRWIYYYFAQFTPIRCQDYGTSLRFSYGVTIDGVQYYIAYIYLQVDTTTGEITQHSQAKENAGVTMSPANYKMSDEARLAIYNSSTQSYDVYTAKYTSSYDAVVEESVIDGTASTPGGRVNMFNPTDAVLSSGFDSAVIEKANFFGDRILTIENTIEGLKRYDESVQVMIDEAMEDIDLSNYATKQYVDDAINTALGVILNGSY